MTKTYYRLSNGSTVKTYAEAVASGCKYTMCYEPIEESRPQVSAETRAKRVSTIMEKRGN